jgi:hypothetical protein
MSEFVEVFTAVDITFAYLIKAILEEAGIPVQIANENLQGAYCLDGMVPRVLVPREDLARARELIEEMQQSSQALPDEDEAWTESSEEEQEGDN